MVIDHTGSSAIAWKAEIPLRLTLAPEDLVADEEPSPVMVMVRRFGYLTFAAEHARPLFQHLLPPGDDTPWLEFKGRPLPWQIPAGVLHDLLCTHSDRPWALTVHYRACPTDVVLPCTQDMWRSNFINSVKEAAVICSGSASRILQMASATQAKLYRSAEAGDMAALSEMSPQLGLPLTSSAQRLPIRVVVHSSDGTIQTVSRPLQLTAGESPKLREVLIESLGSDLELGSEAESPNEADAAPASHTVKIAGICPPLTLPVNWLHATFHAADQFLYIAVILRPLIKIL